MPPATDVRGTRPPAAASVAAAMPAATLTLGPPLAPASLCRDCLFPIPVSCTFPPPAAVPVPDGVEARGALLAEAATAAAALYGRKLK